MRRTMAAVVVSLALVAGACGGSTASPIEVVTASATETADANTASVSERIVIRPPASVTSGDPLVVTGEGEIDFRSRKGSLAVTTAGQTVTVVVDGATIYQHLPALAGATGGKEWFKLDFDDLGEMAGLEGLGSLAQSQNNDPSTFLQFLRGASGKVTEVGKERVGGAETTWYSLTVDVQKAADQVPAEQQATIRQIADTFGIHTIPTEVWIDDQGRARRLKQSFDYSNASPTGKIPREALPSGIEMTLEFSDFGTPVSVEVPPASEVADLFEVLKQVGGD